MLGGTCGEILINDRSSQPIPTVQAKLTQLGVELTQLGIELTQLGIELT